VRAGRPATLRRNRDPDKEAFMSVILIFAGFVLVGDTLAVGISYLVEQVSNSISLMVFLALYILVFWISWKLAVHVTERYVIREQ
jgi:uncharacterized membrane protein YesL